MANRKFIITREKKFVGGGADYLVYIDGKCIGRIDNGETASIVVSPSRHIIYVVAKFSEGSARSNDISMPANDLDYHYRITTSMGLLRGNVSLSEDYEQAAYNRNILEKRQKVNNIISRVDRVMKPIIDSAPVGERDFKSLNTLTVEYTNSEYYKNVINTLRGEYYKAISVKYFDTGISHSKIYQILKEVAEFTRENIATFESLKHYDYMLIDNNMFNSVLSLDTLADLEKIRNKEGLKELTERFTVTYFDAKELSNSGNHESAVNRLLLTDFTEDDLDNAKRWLLFAAMNEGVEKEASEFYDYMMRQNKIIFGDHVLDDNKRKIEILSVDMIIAEALRLHFVNAVDKINENLDNFLNVGCKCFKIGQDQYNILLNVFAFLNAYKQEEMVLEAMVSNYIERTPEQEERLNFLRTQKGGFSTGTSSAYRPIEIEKTPEDKLVYEYRSITWKETDIISYFDSLSMQNQSVNLPFVVNEWSKNIHIEGIKWEMDKVTDRIKQVLVENFDERFQVSVVESGPTGNYTEYDQTTLIVDTSASGYSWITFNVIGEQMMKNQVTLSVYAMYTPELDGSLGESKIERNKSMCNKMLMLNQKQNPKINNFMANLTDLIIKELEKWLNTQNENNIYS